MNSAFYHVSVSLLKHLIKVNQIIAYLACENAEFTRIDKQKRKPDLKRTHITDLECETWSVGDTYAKQASRKSDIVRYLGDNPEAYTKRKVYDSADSLSASITEGSPRRNGYHMRPHLRRAHWHYYWYGKKDGSGERVKRRRFVHAVFIDNTGEDIEMLTREIVA